VPLLFAPTKMSSTRFPCARGESCEGLTESGKAMAIKPKRVSAATVLQKQLHCEQCKCVYCEQCKPGHPCPISEGTRTRVVTLQEVVNASQVSFPKPFPKPFVL
jgi:hypothetical protein